MITDDFSLSTLPQNIFEGGFCLLFFVRVSNQSDALSNEVNNIHPGFFLKRATSQFRQFFSNIVVNRY